MTRSEIMSRIKSSGNKSTEMRFRAALARAGVTGYTVQPKIEGRPDLAFLDEKVAVFLDGCFWHGCGDHYKPSRTNWRMWREKIRRNKERGQESLLKFVSQGWKVFRVWEHDIADAETLKGIIMRVARAADTPTELQFGRPVCRGWAPYADMRNHDAIDRWLDKREADHGRDQVL